MSPVKRWAGICDRHPPSDADQVAGVESLHSVRTLIACRAFLVKCEAIKDAEDFRGHVTNSRAIVGVCYVSPDFAVTLFQA